MREPESRQAGGGACGDGLHVVMILPTYLPESFGGAEQQCRKLSHALADQGVKVTVLAPRLLAATPWLERDGGVTIRRIRLRKAPNLGGRYVGSLLVWSAWVLVWLWRHRRNVDLVHVFHGRLHALPGVIAAALIGKPSLVKIGRGGEHFDLDLVRRKRVIGRLAYRLMLRYTSGYIANSREIVNDLLAHAVRPERICVVPNGVEIPDGRQGREPESSGGSQPAAYVYLGRLDPEKRLDLMLRGFARFPDRSARLAIVGEGECREQLEQLASELGLRARVDFPGRTDDVSAYLHAARFYISTSASEGMSNALLEAMSVGVVPIVSDVSGARDLVTDGDNGFLFAPDDTDEFVAKLELTRDMAADRYGALSEAARAAIRRGFGIAQIAQRHLELYCAALESNGSPRRTPGGELAEAASHGPLRQSGR